MSAAAGLVAFFSSPPAPIHKCRIVTVGIIDLITTALTPTAYTVSILGKDTVQFERKLAGKTERIAVSISTIVAVIYSGENELTIAVSI